MTITTGVLALQGAFAEHITALKKCGSLTKEVRTIDDLNQVDALIIPGGESTTIGLLLEKTGLDKEIPKRTQAGMPIFGTCAGAILLAKTLTGPDQAPTLNLIDLTIERNAYGNQLDSFTTTLNAHLPDSQEIPAVFIRAPRIHTTGPEVKILAPHHNAPVLVQEKNILVATFHPELTESTAVHRYFLSLCKSKKS